MLVNLTLRRIENPLELLHFLLTRKYGHKYDDQLSSPCFYKRGQKQIFIFITFIALEQIIKVGLTGYVAA